MRTKRGIFPWMPILLLIFLFGVDKLLLIPSVRLHSQSWREMGSMMYQSRSLVLGRFTRELPARLAAGEKPALILGASRSAPFDMALLDKLRPGTFTYNFNAPSAPPSDYFYSLEKVTRLTSKLAYIIIEFDSPHLLARTAAQSLAHSYDFDFMRRHVEIGRGRFKDPWNARGKGFSFDEGETWLLKRLFVSYRFPPSLPIPGENMVLPHPNKPGQTMGLWELKRHLLRTIPGQVERNRGSYPPALMFAQNPDAINRHAKHTTRKTLKNFRAAPSQVIFLRKILAHAAALRVPLLIYWPVVAKPLRASMHAAGLVEPHQEKIRIYVKQLEREHPGTFIRIVDFNDDPSFKCRRFLDSFHLNSGCYPELSRRLLKHLP